MADEFAEFGGSAVADAPNTPPADEFAQFGGSPHDDSTVSASVAPTVDPSQAYLDALNSGQTPLPSNPEEHYQAARDFFNGSAPSQIASGIGTGIKNFVLHPTVALGRIGTAIGDWDIKATTEVNRLADQHPFLGLPMAAGELVAGAASGLGNLTLQGRNLVQDTGNALDAIDPANVGKADALGRERAYADYQQRLDAQTKAKDDATISNALGSPAIYSAGQQVAPFLAPLPSLGVAAPVANIAGKIGDLAEGAVNLAGDAAPYVGPVAGAAKGFAVGGPIGGYFGLKSGAMFGGKLAALADKAAPIIGDTTAQIAGAGLNTGAGIGTNIAYGVAGAPAGDAANATEGAIAQGVIQSPLGIIHGANVRQDLNEASLAKQAAVRGMAEYGNDPNLDNATARGIASLPPDQQQAVFEQRGLYRDLQTASGKPIQIHVPDDYANRVSNIAGGKIEDAENSRGYYDGNGLVYINPDTAGDVSGFIRDALGHETNHAAVGNEGAIAQTNPKAFSKFNDAVVNSALNDDLQPTPNFQQFIDNYASSANGNVKTNVDWNSVPISGEGLTRTNFLNEYATEIARAATPGVGKQLAGPELGDRIGDAVNNVATRLGIRNAPDASQILGPGYKDMPTPVDPSALAAARTGLYAIGAKAADSLDSPIRIAQPDKLPQTQGTRPGPAGTAKPSSIFQEVLAQQPPAQSESSPSVTPTAVAPQPQPIIAPIQPSANIGPNIAPIVGARSRISIPARPRLAPDAIATAPEVAARLAPATPQETQGRAVPQQAPQADAQAEGAPVSRFAQEPPETGPTDKEEISNPPQNSLLASNPPAEADATNPTQEAVPKEGAERSQSTEVNQDSPPDASTRPAPLSQADIARINSETEKNFKPAPYKPRGTPQEQAQKIADKNAQDLAQAKFNAVADAHAAALDPDDTRVQMKVDENGKRRVSGTHFVDNDPFHQALLKGDTEAKTRANLPAIQDAIQNGNLLNFDYDSAKEARTEQSAQQRRESQAASTASSRATGIGDIQLQNKAMRPLSVSPNNDGSVGVYGYSPDKVNGNAENVFKILRDNNMADRLPYRDVNDPLYKQDLADAINAHANGYSVQGNRLMPVDGVNVPEPTPGYVPTPLPPARANFINLIMGQEPTLSKPALKGTGAETASGKLRRFAAGNDNVPAENGEVNPLRAELNAKGLLQVGTDKGSKNVIEPAFETTRADLMSNFRDSNLPPDFNAMRGESFRGNRNDVVPGGKVPRSDFAGAGFLPARSAGATPEEPLATIGNRILTPNDFIQTRQDANSGYQLHFVDADKLESTWAKDHREQYIPPGGGGSEIPRRIQGFKDWLQRGKPVQTGSFIVDSQGRGFFDNGRHRTRTLLDAGMRQIPISIHPDSLENARNIGLIDG